MKKTFFSLFFLSVMQNVQAQNVGIGTNTPSEKLHVSGNLLSDTVKSNRLKLATGAGAGKVMTSDAAGNASWQAAVNNSSNHNGNIGYGVWGDCQTNAIISEYQPVEDTPFDRDGAFGFAVAISGDYAIVGSPYSDVGSNDGQGSASIFHHDGTQWVFLQKLSDINGASYDGFGYSVAITGSYAFVGTPDDDVGANPSQGTVSVYKLDGGTWVFMQQIVDGTGAISDNFGVSVSASGNTVIVGADYDDVGANTNQGSASIYHFNGANWVLASKLTAPAGQSEDHFGCSVGISGDYAVVGAQWDDVGGNYTQGSAKVYQKIGANWTFLVSLTDPYGAAGDYFGQSVAISGLTLIVGAPEADVDTSDRQGSASIFEYDGAAWVFKKKLVQSTGESYADFGSSVSISGNYALVGSRWDDLAQGVNAGSATLFQKAAGTWGELQLITDPRGEESRNFGHSTAIDHLTKRFLLGSGLAWTGSDKSNKAFFGKVF